MIFYAFAAFCAMMLPASYHNFRHQVESHQVQAPKIVLQEDVTLKAKGIRLPGYNH